MESSLQRTPWEQIFLATFAAIRSPLSEVKNVLVTPVGAKIFVLSMEVIFKCPSFGWFV